MCQGERIDKNMHEHHDRLELGWGWGLVKCQESREEGPEIDKLGIFSVTFGRFSQHL